MSLLAELSRNPDTTQRELAQRIGVALGLANLMLRRLAKKGYIKISGTKRSRIRYLITPKGILEKSRLTYEFIQYSLQLYSRVRHSLREQLSLLVREGNRRTLLCGTGELAEIAFLTIQETGLELVGIVAVSPDRERFLGYPVKPVAGVGLGDYDRMVVVSLHGADEEVKQLTAQGVPLDRIITLSGPGMPSAALLANAAVPVMPEISVPAEAMVTAESLETA